MKKKYLRIINLSPLGDFKCVSTFLLSGNLSAMITEAGQTRLYFLNCNPFSFIRLYLNYDEWKYLYSIKHNGSTSKDVHYDGSIFRYEIFQAE